VENGVGGGMRCNYCAHKYVNGKMGPAETIPGVGGGAIKVNDGQMNSTIIYSMHGKNFCKCHKVPPAQQ
jgi:hypothetical protein